MRTIIIGGGASGMAAAIHAARRGHAVTLLERQGRVGRKLLSTGNGRCNLSNTYVHLHHYHGTEPDFVQTALEKYPPSAVRDWFRSMGLWTVVEYGGRIYPRSGHAGSVLDVLRLELERLGVEILTSATVEMVEKRDNQFIVHWQNHSVTGTRLIVACGGCAGGKVGGVRDGYDILRSFGHRCTDLRPALTSIRTEPDYPRALKGIRVEAAATLLQNNQRLRTERGDVQFTETGLSGTAIFALSRAAADGGANLTVTLDFFPEEDAGALFRALSANRRRWQNLPANQILTGAVQSRLGQMLCKYAGLRGNTRCGALSDHALVHLSTVMKDFHLPVIGTGGFDNAQVTAGGIATAQFDPNTLQSRLISGLYACGETLDVDGDCGGYNLQWAWASGLLAGELR